MPFIRYKTNDVVTLNNDVKYNISRPYVVSKIDGRVDDRSSELLRVFGNICASSCKADSERGD